MIEAKPELVTMDMADENEHQALHYAVYNRLPKMVRLLMQDGANARKGVWPHREATTALTIATDRGYDEIAAIIQEEEDLRKARAGPAAGHTKPAREELMNAFRQHDEDRILKMIEADPSLIEAHRRPLHAAACMRMERLANWLVGHGYDVNWRTDSDWAPLDMAVACWRQDDSVDRFRRMTDWLREHGAELTPRSAVALGEADWLRTKHAEGKLSNAPVMQRDLWYGGLLSIAARHDRADILELLLDLGFDPDERARVEGADCDGWGGPLEECAQFGRLAMAETLLKRGADPNPKPHLGKAPIAWACEKRDWAMVELLERHGALEHPTSVGIRGDIEKAKKLFAEDAAGRLPEGLVGRQETLAELLLWSSAAGGHPELVRLALPRMTWPRDDPRWWWMLWHPLYRSLECFRLVLERCDPNVRLFFGRTSLHDVMGLHGRDAETELRIAFAIALLDAGARLDLRDDLLKSTPLGWACRWGRVDLVKLLLERGADPVEADAEPWATPRAWAEKKKHSAVLALLNGVIV